MKKGLLIIIVLLIILLIYRFATAKSGQLGSLSVKRPPKIRIVYSKKQKVKDRTQLTSSTTAVEVLRSIWTSQMEVREEFVVLFLDRANRVLGYQHISKGGISGTVVDVRLVYAAALQALASGIILAHNHPSGNTKASGADIEITKKIKQAGELHDIALLDHIILTKESYISFSDEGLL